MLQSEQTLRCRIDTRKAFRLCECARAIANFQIVRTSSCRIWHSKGFSPVWMRSCAFKCPDSVKVFVQNLHSNGLSPVWMRSCVCKLPDFVNVFMQNLHSNGFSPVWMRSCTFKSSVFVNLFLQNFNANRKSQESTRLFAFNDLSSQLTSPMERLLSWPCCRRDITKPTLFQRWPVLEDESIWKKRKSWFS